MGLRQQVFLKLSTHAKMHKQLDNLQAVQSRLQRDVQRIEEAEIRAYDNDARFQELERMKKELLAIRFVQQDELHNA
jgi:hypothetical protein